MPGSTATPPRRSRIITALLALVVLVSLGVVGYSLWTLNQQRAHLEHTEAPLAPKSSFKPVSVPTPTPTTTAETQSTQTPADDMDGSQRALRPGEDDPGLHTLVNGQIEGTDESSMDSPAWQGLINGMGDPQAVPASMAQAWECHDGEAEIGMGQVDWDKAERVTGAAVFVPSVCLASPVIATDLVTASDGTRQLQLPETPWSTWYKQSAPPAAAEGNTYIASHVNSYGHWENGPFRQLEAVPMGAPIIVRDEAGHYTVFTASESFTALQSDAVNDPALNAKLFRLDGEHTLSLITCVRGTSGRFDTNRILMATVSR